MKTVKLSQENIKQYIEAYFNERNPDERFTSFDYCYNYFYSFYKNKKLAELANEKNLQRSCLQIGFFLASFGMMKGKAFLLKKSVGYYKNLIEVISKTKPELWEIDIPDYDDEKISSLLGCKQRIIDALGKENKPSDTLITKIMFGVFANVPAYDRYFKKFLQKQGYCQTFNKDSLKQLQEFYKENKDIFDSYKIKTLDFQTGKETDIKKYTKAKLIDMCGFMDGQKKL